MASCDQQSTIAALAFGTLGDVIPVAVVVSALAKAKRNSCITFITHAAHEKFLRGPLASAGVVFSTISTPPVVSVTQMREEGFVDSSRWKKSADHHHHEECLEAVDKIFGSRVVGRLDFILFNFFALEGWHLAELYGVQCVVAAPYIVPYSAPTAFQRQFRSLHPLLYERLQGANPGEVGWAEVMHWMWPLFTDRWVMWRTDSLHLSPLPLTDPVTALPISHNWPQAPPLLYGFSEAVVECPGYWPSSVRVCGFWFPPTDWWAVHNIKSLPEHPHLSQVKSDFVRRSFTPPQKLSQFLEVGIGNDCNACRPIFFGMSSIGSMGLLANAEIMLEVLKQVLQASNQRAVLLTSGHPPLDSIIMATASHERDQRRLLFSAENGIASLEQFDSINQRTSTLEDGITIFGGRLFSYSGFVPYTWLFPCCLLAFHHGGSGTTAAALLSGIPQIICPFVLDQFYWAERMAWIGVGPQPLKPAHLFPADSSVSLEESVTTVLKAVQEAASSRMQSCASKLARQIQKEDGVLAAMSVLLEEFGASER